MSNKLRIAILGGTGMLGNEVGRFFSELKQYKTFISYKNAELANKLDFCETKFYFDAMNYNCIETLPDVDYVINCIGCIKQKNYDVRTYMKINAQFPHFLANACEKRNIRLIHVTTDCVFTGKRGGYHELDEPDCSDDYGISKELGEPMNCMVLRTSVIGKEIRENYSLLEWARSQRGKTVKGFVNHYWNGLTSLEYANTCHKLIMNDWYAPVKRHIFSTKISKHDMLVKFNEHFDLNLTIEPYVHELQIDRTLSTVYDLNDKLGILSFDEMIEKL